VLEGSNNGYTWNLIMCHKRDASLFGVGSTKTWPIPASNDQSPAAAGAAGAAASASASPTRKAYRMFRVLQTGKNSNSNYYLSCSGFEVYGTLYVGAPSDVEDVEVRSSATSCD
jgi:hypothetical protein